MHSIIVMHRFHVWSSTFTAISRLHRCRLCSTCLYAYDVGDDSIRIEIPNCKYQSIYEIHIQSSHAHHIVQSPAPMRPFLGTYNCWTFIAFAVYVHRTYRRNTVTYLSPFARLMPFPIEFYDAFNVLSICNLIIEWKIFPLSVQISMQPVSDNMISESLAIQRKRYNEFIP